MQEERAQLSINDVIMWRLEDLSKLMERMEHRQEKLEEQIVEMRREVSDLSKELYETRKEISERLDKFSERMASSTNHGQIATISSVGIGLSAVSITLGVLYALIFK